MEKNQMIIPIERIDRAIYLIRGQRIMLDADLALLYGVSAGRLNEAVRRNTQRFPADFMFQLTQEEFEELKAQIGRLNLKSQIAISSSGWGGRRHPPYAFTEQGVAMLSTVLRSDRAIRVNIEIMRAFVRMRQILATNADLERRLSELEKKYDAQFRIVFDALRQLMAPPAPSRKQIGFEVKERAALYGRKAKKSLG
ncbi:MAG TPA: ORF6N domain-containing protein [Thermodesulfobacteriota bacterium]|nr:ORF6N domain-containing protein [Thermodesulfobacteriota bacterium]